MNSSREAVDGCKATNGGWPLGREAFKTPSGRGLRTRRDAASRHSARVAHSMTTSMTADKEVYSMQPANKPTGVRPCSETEKSGTG